MLFCVVTMFNSFSNIYIQKIEVKPPYKSSSSSVLKPHNALGPFCIGETSCHMKMRNISYVFPEDLAVKHVDLITIDNSTGSNGLKTNILTHTPILIGEMYVNILLLDFRVKEPADLLTAISNALLAVLSGLISNYSKS